MLFYWSHYTRNYHRCHLSLVERGSKLFHQSIFATKIAFRKVNHKNAQTSHIDLLETNDTRNCDTAGGYWRPSNLHSAWTCWCCFTWPVVKEMYGCLLHDRTLNFQTVRYSFGSDGILHSMSKARETLRKFSFKTPLTSVQRTFRPVVQYLFWRRTVTTCNRFKPLKTPASVLTLHFSNLNVSFVLFSTTEIIYLPRVSTLRTSHIYSRFSSVLRCSFPAIPRLWTRA